MSQTPSAESDTLSPRGVDDRAPALESLASDPSAVDDETLLRGVALGDASALKALHQRHSAWINGLALRILRNKTEAEEVLQDTFIELWRTASRYDAKRSAVRGYLAVIARTRAFDRIRRVNTQQRLVEVAQAQSQSQAPSREAPADELLAQNQTHLRTRAAMRALSVPQQEALKLAFEEGLTHSEIAERTGLPLGTVKTRIRGALQRLSVLLTGEARTR